MKILLTAVNAKYIHSNPAVYSLRACAGERFRPSLEIAEYTINNRKEEILADIYRRKPDVIAFSCYIWNWSMIGSLLRELPKILPGVPIWLGGPEVSYDSGEVLRSYPMVTGIMTGEGEETFRELTEYYGGIADGSNEESNGDAGSRAGLNAIRGIVYRTQNDEICRTPVRELTDISALPFLYNDLERFENKIIYYESSRGCPYRCSYCLSSIDKKVRLRDIDIVKKELQFFLDNKVKQVKFVDRTFNCDHEHAKEIWKYLAEHDNGVTNFHFEIAADIMTEEELQILADMRPGLAQLEIGIQTVNPETLREIRRTADLDRIRRVVKRIEDGHNIHVHLDLIAGLPYEDYESFLHSFNSVYEMRPQQLQLGFLKVLKGSYLWEKAADHGIQYMDVPPYEVLSTKWISYGELLRLKQVEEMVELYYNSNQFAYTLPVLQTVFSDAYEMYLGLSDFYREKGYLLSSPSRSYRYQALLDFAINTALPVESAMEMSEWKEMLRQVLTFDLYLRENMKSRPDFAKDLSPYKSSVHAFYKKEEESRHYLPDYAGYDGRQLSKMTHMEIFDYPVWEPDVRKRMRKLEAPCMVLFDYKERDALTYAARYAVIPADRERISDR
ncbi:MAG: B12-binding domain-containing radical SAM protein [Lachnospiraceae bacterium]|nr:B12-binding domain-containing radical SAM protein [Lachnospiraceae bacterium]